MSHTELMQEQVRLSREVKQMKERLAKREALLVEVNLRLHLCEPEANDTRFVTDWELPHETSIG